MGSDLVKSESPQLRSARLDTIDAFAEKGAAAANLHDVLARRDKALMGVTDPAQRDRINAGFQGEIDAAQGKVKAAELGVSEALQTEMTTALSAHGAGPYIPEQIDAAVRSVLVAHPELMDPANQDFANRLLVGGEILKVKPGIETNFTNLKVDANTPPWMRNLIEHGNKHTAALIVSLGMANEQPLNGNEKLLAEKDPLAFALLRYSGAHLPDELKWGNFSTPQQLDDARKFVIEQVLGMAAKGPEQRQKLAKAQMMILATGELRAEWVGTQLPPILAAQSPEDGVNAIQSRPLPR
jgi:hypothetical protein